MRSVRALTLMAILALLPSFSWAEMTLLMAEEDGCFWCQRWDEEIADIYPKTPEGQAAPLHRVDLHAPTPEGVTLARELVFTPTFVLLEDGNEIGRIEGYPGEDFFWGLLGVLLRDAGVQITTSG